MGATVWPVLGGRVGRSVGVGFGTDLSEEPVYQVVSRPRWNKSRTWCRPGPTNDSVDDVAGVGSESPVDHV